MLSSAPSAPLKAGASSLAGTTEVVIPDQARRQPGIHHKVCRSFAKHSDSAILYLLHLVQAARKGAWGFGGLGCDPPEWTSICVSQNTNLADLR